MPPFQGWVALLGRSHGVALGWLVFAPLVLLLTELRKVHDTLYPAKLPEARTFTVC